MCNIIMTENKPFKCKCQTSPVLPKGWMPPPHPAYLKKVGREELRCECGQIEGQVKVIGTEETCGEWRILG